MNGSSTLSWAARFCAVMLLVGASHHAAAQSGTFITFDAPGALGTTVEGINSSATVAGVYYDAQLSNHGFIRDSSGNFTIVDEPDAAQGAYLGTTVFAINDSGEVAGWYAPISNPLVFQGFIRDAQGNFTSVGVPQFEATMVYALGNSGELAGCAQQSAFCSDIGGGTNEGFIRQASGAIFPFVPPNATNVTPRAMNSKNAVTGSYSDSKNEIHGFVMTAGGKITEFSMPQFQGPGVGTFPRGINDSNVITGLYYDPKLIARGFIRQPNGKATVINVPGAGVRTYPVAINAGGTITGAYSDSAGNYYAFIRDPLGHFTTFGAPGTGTFGTGAIAINNSGVVTGGYYDSASVFHGFVRTP